MTWTVNVRGTGVVLPQTTAHCSVTGWLAVVWPQGLGLTARMNGVGGSGDTSQFGNRTVWVLLLQAPELHACSVIDWLPLVSQAVANVLPVPVLGVPPPADHDHDETVPLTVGLQLNG